MNPERLAYWYFRLNGFLTTENFIVHPDCGRDQRTDADLLAVRFVYRAENLDRAMEDDPCVVSCNTFANVIIAEVKKGVCSLNGPWTEPEKQNMERVVKAIGCVPDAAISHACESLYKKGNWYDTSTTIRLFTIGERKSSELIISHEQQLTWSDIINFCQTRFETYRQQKSSVSQWTADGKKLRDACLGRSPAAKVRKLFELHEYPDHSETFP